MKINLKLNEIPRPGLVPEGRYEALIEEAKKVAMTTGNGDRLAVPYLIKGPAHEGRTVRGNFNLWHKKPEVAMIAMGELAGLVAAAGLHEISDTEELEGLRVGIIVGIGLYEGKKVNRVLGYFAPPKKDAEMKPFDPTPDALED